VWRSVLGVKFLWRSILSLGLVLSATGWSTSSDNRPRDVTLLLRTPSTLRLSNGETSTSPMLLRIFFARDGTAFVEMDKGTVIKLPPDKRSGSLTATGGERWTTEISGSSDALNIDLLVQRALTPDFPSVSYNMRVQYVLSVSQGACAVQGGDAKAWLEGKPPKPLSITLTKDAQTCDMQPGRHLLSDGSAI
jgi:hypothetical protein